MPDLSQLSTEELMNMLSPEDLQQILGDAQPKPKEEPSLGQALKNNIVAAANTAFPFADEGAAALRSVIPEALTSAFGKTPYGNYDQELAAIRGGEKDWAKSHPYQSGLSGLTGILASAPALPSKIAETAGLIPKLGQALLEGAGYGGLYGFGSGEGGTANRLESAASGAATGAIAAPALTATASGIGGLAKLIGRLKNPGEVPISNLESPEVQTALNLAERTNMLNQPAAETTSIGQGTKQAIELVNKQAQSLPENIAAQLGADAGDTAVEKALSQQFKKALPELMDSGIFQDVKSVPELAEKASSQIDQINLDRQQAAKYLEAAASSLNKGKNRTADMVGVITSDTPEIRQAADALRKRIDKLSLNELSKPIADSIENTQNSILNDLRPTSTKPITPSRAVDMQQNLNEVRRNLLREFDTLNIAKKIDGNTPGNLSSLEASIEAVSKLQNALSNALESATKQVADKTGLDIAPDMFSKLNDQYGAFRALEDMSDKFLRGTAKGRAVRDPTRIVQNASTEQVLPSAFTPRKFLEHGALKKLAQYLDLPNEALRRAQNVESRDTDAISNIQDLIALNRSPVNLTPREPGASDMISNLANILGGYSSRIGAREIPNIRIGNSLQSPR